MILLFHKTYVVIGCSLEAPRRDDSNERFYEDLTKIIFQVSIFIKEAPQVSFFESHTWRMTVTGRIQDHEKTCLGGGGLLTRSDTKQGVQKQKMA